MKVPYHWLKEYVSFDASPEELAEKLTMAGLEVESVEHVWNNIITARINHLEPVKGSSHLNATKIFTGEGRELSVVCGAPNIKEGDIVPLALPGAQFFNDAGETLTIQATKKMGVVSEGMLCSPRELGLSSDHEGIYILPNDTPLGVSLADAVIHLDIKAHRGDLFSMVGIAREMAALFGAKLKQPEIKLPEKGKNSIKKMASITVKAEDDCPRFTARVIRNIKMGKAPLWMAQRLALAGMRSINVIVDITNYVMLELGQPLHAFDYDKVANHHLIIRRAEPGETLGTLDGAMRELTPDMVLVCDESGPLSVAGVMGGASSEISSDTTQILLEAASWNPVNIRKTSAKLGLRSEASSRYEKGVDPELALQGLNRAAQLMAELAGGEIVPGYLESYAHPSPNVTIPFHASACEWLLGYSVTPEEAAGALRSLEFAVEQNSDDGSMLVTVPSWRGDILESADLVEEIARELGYDRITGKYPTGDAPEPQAANWFDIQYQFRRRLQQCGCAEIVTYPLTNQRSTLQLLTDESDTAQLLIGAVDELAPAEKGKKNNGKNKQKQQSAQSVSETYDQAIPPLSADELPAVRLVNAISAKMDMLRITLMNAMLETISANLRYGNASLRLFEIGRRYIALPNSERQLPDERRTLCVGLTGYTESWTEPRREYDFFDMKAIIENIAGGLHMTNLRFTQTQSPIFHPGRCALLEVEDSHAKESRFHTIGVMGEVHPIIAERFGISQRTYLCEIDLARLYLHNTPPRFQPISRYPALTRDIAVVADISVPAQTIADVIKASGGELTRSVTLFDVYMGDQIPEGKRSLAFTVEYQAQDRNLSDADGDFLREQTANELKKQVHAVVRE